MSRSTVKSNINIYHHRNASKCMPCFMCFSISVEHLHKKFDWFDICHGPSHSKKGSWCDVMERFRWEKGLFFCAAKSKRVLSLACNFHQIIFVNSRVMSRSHCPKSFCFYRSTSLTVLKREHWKTDMVPQKVLHKRIWKGLDLDLDPKRNCWIGSGSRSMFSKRIGSGSRSYFWGFSKSLEFCLA